MVRWGALGVGIGHGGFVGCGFIGREETGEALPLADANPVKAHYVILIEIVVDLSDLGASVAFR